MPSPPRGLVEVALPALPFVALVPNFFVIPDLAYNGLATQELVFACSALILVLLALVDLLRGRARAPAPLDPALLAVLAAFVAWQAIALAWTPDPAEGWRVGGVWLGLLVLAAAALGGAEERVAGRLRGSLTAVTLLLAAVQLYEYVRYGGVMLGILFNHGIASELLALLLPLQVAAWLAARRWWVAGAHLLASALAVAALVSTLRRGALLGTLVAGLGLGLAALGRRLPVRSGWRAAAVAGVLLLVVAPLAARERAAIQERFEGATRIEARELGLRSRLMTWAVAWEMARRHPLGGVGAGGYAASYGSLRRDVVDQPRYAALVEASDPEDFDEVRSPLAHSEYLQVLAELGLVGLGLFLATWTLVGRRLWRAARGGEHEAALPVLCGLAALAVSSAVSGFSLRFTPGATLVGCVLALGLAGGPRPSRPAAPPGRRGWREAAALLALALLLVPCGLSAWRAQRVLASQRAQSQLDFRVGRDAATNAGLLARYREVLALDPLNAGAHLGLGLLRYQVGPVEESVSHVEQAFRHGYGRPFACLLLAFAREAAGRLPDAVAVAGDCAAAFPRSVVTRAAHAVLLRKAGDPEAAARQQAMAEARDPRLARSWTLALRLRREPAAAEAAREGLVTPDALTPKLVRGLVQARAHLYLR